MDNFAKLTIRERQLLDSASAGFTDRETAEQLGISINTVSTYWKRLYNRLGVETRAQAVSHFAHWQHSPQNTVPNADHASEAEIPISPNREAARGGAISVPGTKDEWRHWINTPLQHIIEISSLLISEVGPSENRQKLEIIELSAELLQMRLAMVVELLEPDSILRLQNASTMNASAL